MTTDTSECTIKRYRRTKIEKIIRQLPMEEAELKISLCRNALGITKRFTSIMNNTYMPTIEELVVIASVLDTTIDELIETK